MPQTDRRRGKSVPIEYEAREDLTGLPRQERVSLVLVTDGKAGLLLNGQAHTLAAPCALCVSPRDRLQVMENGYLYAQSFHLDPVFMKTRLTFRQIRRGAELSSEEAHRQDMLRLFFMREPGYHGVLELPPEGCRRIYEWLSVIGNEIDAQSDGVWTCRIRQYFLQIVNLLDDIYDSRGAKTGPAAPADTVMEYIHTHYMRELSLEKLCGLVHVNRTTLNQLYRARTGRTVMEYLLAHRLRIAQELLAHTGLTLDEVARATGFRYDTYLIRQFTAKIGETPTAYRKAAREKYGIRVYKP